MTRYCTPKLVNPNPAYPHPLPLLPMDLHTKRNIELTVSDILNSSDIDAVTERDVREAAAARLGLDLSGLAHKTLVRHLIESFLLSLDHPSDVERENNAAVDGDGRGVGVGERVEPPAIDGGVQAVAPETQVAEEMLKRVKEGSSPETFRVICKLSNKREVAIRGSGEKAVVSIRELLWKDGKSFPTHKCMNLSSEQWSIFRRSFPAIEEAITKMESRLRSELERKQADNRQDSSKFEDKHNYGDIQTKSSPKRKEGIHHRPEVHASAKLVDRAFGASTPRGLVPTEIIRFNGKNYQQWANRMESYLDHLKVAYVLSEPCPIAVDVIERERSQTLAAMRKWVDDDHICRQNILNSLCDNLYGYYYEKSGTAGDLWEELKHTYLCEEHGAKVSLVRKYIEFQIVDEKPIFEQVQELHHIADSLIAAGMYVEEKFHVNVIISKLPPSWKPFSIELMKEDYLPVWMLMNRLKSEEETQLNGNKGGSILPRPDVPVVSHARKLGPQRVPMKKPGVPVANEPDREWKFKFCTICKKKGHLPEQCWFRKPDSKDNINEKDNFESTNTATGRKMDGAAD